MAKFILIMAYEFLQAWLLMLALGMIAIAVHFHPMAFGYWFTFLVSSLLSMGLSSEFAREIRDH